MRFINWASRHARAARAEARTARADARWMTSAQRDIDRDAARNEAARQRYLAADPGRVVTAQEMSPGNWGHRRAMELDFAAAHREAGDDTSKDSEPSFGREAGD
jgi:hypothetical protein